MGLSVLVLGPGFPVADRPYYTPCVVETLSMIARTHALALLALSDPPDRGWHAYRGAELAELRELGCLSKRKPRAALARALVVTVGSRTMQHRAEGFAIEACAARFSETLERAAG
jgi:hypothetical protein